MAGELKKEYGFLTPVGEQSLDGIRHIICRCRCGNSRFVQPESLTSYSVRGCVECTSLKLVPPRRMAHKRLQISVDPEVFSVLGLDGENPKAEAMRTRLAKLAEVVDKVDEVRSLMELQRMLKEAVR